eukprot:Em0573g1a
MSRCGTSGTISSCCTGHSPFPFGYTPNTHTGELVRNGQATAHLDVSCSQPPTAKTGAGPVNLEPDSSLQPRYRYLARKHLGIWMRRTFGRELPHVADQHHTLSLERRVFSAWREVWWCARWEWKLVIRADCHNRYRLWLRVWKAWSLYVRAKKEKKRKKKVAGELAAINLERCVWLAWCEYVAVRKQRRDQRREAQEWYNGHMVRLAWGMWRRAIGFSLQRMAAETLAHQCWVHSLQRRSWSTWITALQSQRTLNSKVAASHQHRNHALLQKTWGRGEAERFHTTWCLTRLLDVWRARFLRSRQMAKFAEEVLKKGQMARKRRMFACWKLFRELCLSKRALQTTALQHLAMSLKRKVLLAFKSYTMQQLNQRAANVMARQFALKKSVAHWWMVWMRRWEVCEEAKQLPLTKKALHHYQHHLIGQVTSSWMEYVMKKALPRCFAAMREFVVYVAYKREIMESAQTFRGASVLKSHFGVWCEAFRLRQDIRMMERMAILHREDIVKRQMLKTWKLRTKGALRHLQKEGRALHHYHRCMKSGVLSKWRQYVHMRHARVLHQHLALQHCSVGLLKKAWGGWTLYVSRQRDTHKSSFVRLSTMRRFCCPE